MTRNRTPDRARRRERRRILIRLVFRSLLTTVVIVTVYYLLPLRHPQDAGLLLLVGGLIAVAVVLVVQVQAIMTAKYPRLAAVEAVCLGGPLLLVVFAATYYEISGADPGSFSQPMNKTAALYFTITVFATVGFGDITAVADYTRILVSIQMLIDLLVIGVVAKLLFGAIEHNLQHRSGTEQNVESAETGAGQQPSRVTGPDAEQPREDPP